MARRKGSKNRTTLIKALRAAGLGGALDQLSYEQLARASVYVEMGVEPPPHLLEADPTPPPEPGENTPERARAIYNAAAQRLPERTDIALRKLLKVFDAKTTAEAETIVEAVCPCGKS